MSINIVIFGVRDIIIPRINKRDTQHIFFDCWQTPDEVTESICELSHQGIRLERYIDWVKGKSVWVEDVVWQKGDDLLDPDSYTGVERYNDAEEHLEDLEGWLSSAKAGGYDVFVDCN